MAVDVHAMSTSTSVSGSDECVLHTNTHVLLIGTKYYESGSDGRVSKDALTHTYTHEYKHAHIPSVPSKASIVLCLAGNYKINSRNVCFV